jgi:hypothetical protein
VTRNAALLATMALVVAACPGGASPSPSPAPPTASASASAVATPGPTTVATPSASGSPTSPVNPAWARLGVGEGPAPREDHTWSVDPASGTAWLFGGRNGGTVFDDVWSFDLATERWTAVDAAGDAPEARFGHTGTWVDGFGLVVWSGQSGGDFFADIRAFDPATIRWTELPAAGAPPEARYGSCAALGPDGRVWISHGFTHAGRFADTRGYDFATRAWAEVSVEGKRPVKRCLHDCLWTPDGLLVLYAGQTDGVAALGDLWTLDPAGRWTEAATPDPAARQLYALAGTGSSGWVFGGRDVNGAYLDDLWNLDLATLRWRPVEAGIGPAGRAGATLVDDPARGRLLLFGGVGESGASDEMWELALR